MNKEQIAKLKELAGKLNASGIASRADAELVQVAYDALAERTTSPVSQMTDEKIAEVLATAHEAYFAASKPYPTRPDCEAEAMTPAVVDHMKMARFSELVEDWPSWEEDIRAWQATQTQPIPQPSFDQAEFDAMVEKGTKAWAGVPAPRQEPEPAAEPAGNAGSDELLAELLARTLPPSGYEGCKVIERDGVLYWARSKDIRDGDKICFFDGDCRDVRPLPQPVAEQGELPPLPEEKLLHWDGAYGYEADDMRDYARAHEAHLMQSYAPLTDAASAKHRIEKLEATIAEWEKLKDPIVLRANLLRGFPARLTTEQLVHIAGDEVQRAVAASQQAAEPRACQHDFRHFSGTLFRRCIRCDDIETPCTNSIAAPAIQQPQWKPPRTADELIAFIGSHCASMDTDGPVDDRMIRLSFHDLRSAFNFAGAYEAIQQPQDDHSEPDNPLFLALAKKGGA